MTTTTTEMAFTREDMLDPIERMFEREYSNKYNVFEELLTTTEGGSGLADLAYVQGSEKGLHVVRIEESYRDCLTNVNAGVHSLSKIESNYRWLAVPLHEFPSVSRDQSQVSGFVKHGIQGSLRGVRALIRPAPTCQGGFVWLKCNY